MNNLTFYCFTTFVQIYTLFFWYLCLFISTFPHLYWQYKSHFTTPEPSSTEQPVLNLILATRCALFHVATNYNIFSRTSVRFGLFILSTSGPTRIMRLIVTNTDSLWYTQKTNVCRVNISVYFTSVLSNSSPTNRSIPVIEAFVTIDSVKNLWRFPSSAHRFLTTYH